MRSLSIALLLLAAASAQAQAPQQKLNQTLSSLSQSKEKQQEIARALSSTRGELDRLRSRATELAATVQQNEREANRAEAKLSRLNRALLDKERAFNARKDEYARTVISLLHLQELPPTALFASPGELDTMLRTGEVLRETNHALASRAKALQRDVREVTRLREQMRSATQRASAARASLQEKQSELAAELAQRQKLQSQLTNDYASTRSQVNRLSRESASLQELIGKIEKARSTPQMAKKAPSPTAPLATPVAGHLRLPVAGSVRHRFGDRKSTNETYRGLVLAARNGATVVTPAAGEVVFTGPFMDYGRMVLLKHGNGIISLLAGLGSISVGLNQQVNAGEPLGQMGGKGELYIELRQHSKPIDPARWFAKLPTRVAAR